MSLGLRSYGSLLLQAFNTLKRNDPLILASSTAFFTTFALSPILIILLNVLSLYFQDDVARTKIFAKIKETFGAETSSQIEEIVRNLMSHNGNWWITIFGFLFLIFVATTLLKVVKQAINHLWRVKRKEGHRLRYNFVERAKAFSLILGIGLLFLVSILLDTMVGLLHDYLHDFFPNVHVAIIRAINILFSLIVVTVWFMMLFKTLPDAKIHWRVAFAGGLMTAILFSMGKWLLGKLLLYNSIKSVFGASTTFALILLFIFYTSLILYYGAAFTFVYAKSIKMPISPGKYGDRYELSIIASENDS